MQLSASAACTDTVWKGMCNPKALCSVIFGVNGSTATATEDDHTVRKWIGFTKVNGGRRFIVGNAFAFRATDVRELATAVDPVGPENEIHLERIIRDADVLVPCWGAELSCLSLCMFIWTGF